MTGSATFTQPDYTAQEGSTYPLAIDAAIAVLARLGGGFAVHEQSTPDMTVAIDAGWIPKAGALPTEVPAQNTGTITAPSGNPRYDIVYVDANTGTVGVATGSEAASPSDPSIPAGKIAVARLRLDNSPATTAIDNTLIDPLRNVGMFNTGTSAGNLVVLDSSARLPAVDGSQLTNVSDQETGDNVMALAWDVLELGGSSVAGLANMVVDAFEDETGVDGTASTNETYDGTNDLYENPGVETLISQGTGTNIGGMTGGGGLAAAFDGNTSQTATASATEASVTVARIGKDYGSGTERVVTGMKTWGANNDGYSSSGAPPTIDLVLKASNTDPTGTGWTGDTIGTIAQFSDGSTALPKETLGNANATAYRYVWCEITCSASSTLNMAEVEFYEAGTAPDMTLVSETITAGSDPAELRIGVEFDNQSDPTLGTDLIIEGSIDDGSTWAEVASYTEYVKSGNVNLVFGTADVSGQTGTDVRIRARTANNTYVPIRKWGVQADQDLTAP
jgi:hypothetical protein